MGGTTGIGEPQGRNLSGDGHIYAVLLRHHEGKVDVFVTRPFNTLPGKDSYAVRLSSDSARKIFNHPTSANGWKSDSGVVKYAESRKVPIDSLSAAILMVRDVVRLSRLEAKIFHVRDGFADAVRIDGEEDLSEGSSSGSYQGIGLEKD